MNHELRWCGARTRHSCVQRRRSRRCVLWAHHIRHQRERARQYRGSGKSASTNGVMCRNCQSPTVRSERATRASANQKQNRRDLTRHGGAGDHGG